MRRSLKNEAKNYLAQSTKMLVTLEAGFYIANNYLGYDIDYFLPVALALGGNAALGFLDARPAGKQRSITAGAMQSGRSVKVNGR